MHGGNLAKDIANILATTDTLVEKLTVNLCNEGDVSEEEEESEEEGEASERQKKQQTKADEERFYGAVAEALRKAPIRNLKLIV